MNETTEFAVTIGYDPITSQIEIQNQTGRIVLADLFQIDNTINRLIEIREALTDEEFVREGT